jgi:hypothetical protein
MIIQQLTWDANLSAFTMWLVIGVFYQYIEFKIKPILKGLLISFMVLLPSAIIIGWQEPFNLIPIFIMTILLGILLGYFSTKLSSKFSI